MENNTSKYIYSVLCDPSWSQSVPRHVVSSDNYNIRTDNYMVTFSLDSSNNKIILNTNDNFLFPMGEYDCFSIFKNTKTS